MFTFEGLLGLASRVIAVVAHVFGDLVFVLVGAIVLNLNFRSVLTT